MSVTALVDSVLEALLAGDHPVLNVLRVQLGLTDVRIERTEIGLFAHFTVPPEAPRCPVPTAVLDDVQLILFDMAYPTCCMLFVKDGVLEVLECYDVADQNWPEFPQVERMQYLLYRPEPVRPGVEGKHYAVEPIQERDVLGLERMWAE